VEIHGGAGIDIADIGEVPGDVARGEVEGAAEGDERVSPRKVTKKGVKQGSNHSLDYFFKDAFVFLQRCNLAFRLFQVPAEKGSVLEKRHKGGNDIVIFQFTVTTRLPGWRRFPMAQIMPATVTLPIRLC
jgi:hypothetical protein